MIGPTYEVKAALDMIRSFGCPSTMYVCGAVIGAEGREQPPSAGDASPDSGVNRVGSGRSMACRMSLAVLAAVLGYTALS